MRTRNEQTICSCCFSSLNSQHPNLKLCDRGNNPFDRPLIKGVAYNCCEENGIHRDPAPCMRKPYVKERTAAQAESLTAHVQGIGSEPEAGMPSCEPRLSGLSPSCPGGNCKQEYGEMRRCDFIPRSPRPEIEFQQAPKCRPARPKKPRCCRRCRFPNPLLFRCCKERLALA